MHQVALLNIALDGFTWPMTSTVFPVPVDPSFAEALSFQGSQMVPFGWRRQTFLSDSALQRLRLLLKAWPAGKWGIFMELMRPEDT